MELISTKRHTEISPRSGDPVYVIETYLKDYETQKITNVLNTEFNKELYNVRFYNGRGRTTSREKAKLLSEQHDYVVYLHKDVEPWLEVKEGRENTDAAFLDTDEEDAQEIDES